MAGVESNEIDGDVLSVLLHPSTVPVINLFRAQGDLRISDDLAVLEDAERELSRYTSRASARSVVSEAILLAFSLAREREFPMVFHRVGARRTSSDERALLAIVSAGGTLDDTHALKEAASDLGVPAEGLTTSAAQNLAARLEEAALPWPPFRSPRKTARPNPVAWPVAGPDDAAFQFKK